MPQRRNTHPTQPDAAALPRPALTHGQTIWVLSELGFHHGVSASTFNHYVKSLRRLDVPFGRGKGRSEGSRNFTYDFEELIELALALLLRVYGVLPDRVVEGLRTFRKALRPIYRQAYFELTEHRYPPARVSAGSGRLIELTGLYLDLNIRYSACQMLEFGPPKAISPFEAVLLYAQAEAPARSYLPLNLSAVTEMIVARTRTLPPKRSGRSPKLGGPT
jgi:hypothetical protein